jgi:hypothetical protein
VAVGGVIAVGAKSDYDAVASSCPARGCTQDAFDARTSARSRADVATVMMIMGGAAFAAGVVLFLWPSSAGAPRAGVAVGARDARFVVAF